MGLGGRKIGDDSGGVKAVNGFMGHGSTMGAGDAY